MRILATARPRCNTSQQEASSHTVWASGHIRMLMFFVVMQPDGHCMYRAVQDQLSLRSDGDSHPAEDVAALRKKTADYIRHHQDDFLPFLRQV